MDLFEELTAENARIARLARALEDAPAGRPAERAARRAELDELLRCRRRLEEDFLHPLLARERETRELSKAVRKQMDAVERDLEALREVPPEQRVLQHRAEALAAAFERLAEREEGMLFPAAARILPADPVRALGERAARLRKESVSAGRARAERAAMEHPPGGDEAGQERDERIRREALRALHEDPRIDAVEIDIEVHRGRVSLHGIVASDEARAFALAAIRALPEVADAVSRLAVRGEASQPSHEDAALRASVEQALVQHAGIAAEDMRVEVRDGVAMLDGTVDSPEKRGRAEEIAAQDTRIRGVENRLAVAPASAGEDRDLAEQIADVLEASPAVNAEDVLALVEQGVVTLRGAVPSREALRAAQQEAKRTAGVRDVRNELEAQPPVPER